MIKGKKIESVNLQLLHTTKSNQKQGGFAVGKEFMLQKKDISAVKDQKQYLMEQDVTQKCKSQMETQQKNNKIQVQSNQWTKTAQTKSKNQNGCDLKSTKVIQKMANGRKKSKERQPVKKQNRMINNKPIKQTKNEVVKEETSMKNTKKQQKKSDTLEISLKMQKKNSQHIQKPISNNLNMHLPPTPIPQSQLIQDTNHSFQEVEQERIQTPNPIIQQNIDPEIDYLQQISFGNQQQAASMPLNPMRYENSNDQECLGDNYLCTTQNEEEYISHPNDKELNLDSQLFSLTAQQLLAKEYFSI